MPRYALLDPAGNVVNVALFDGAVPADWPVPEGHSLVALPADASAVAPGWRRVGAQWTAPAAAPVDPVDADIAAAEARLDELYAKGIGNLTQAERAELPLLLARQVGGRRARAKGPR